MPAVTNAWADRLLEFPTSQSRTHRPPTSATAVQFHDRIAFTGELHGGSRGEMTHDQRAVQHVDFVLAQAFQRLRLIFGQINRAGDVSVGCGHSHLDGHGDHWQDRRCRAGLGAAARLVPQHDGSPA